MDEAEAAFAGLAREYPNDWRIPRDIQKLADKRLLMRAEYLVNHGRYVETEATLKEVVAAATGDLLTDRAQARVDLIALYLRWPRTEAIAPVWNEFASDPGKDRTRGAVRLGEKFREHGAFDLSRTAFELAAEDLSTATSESDTATLSEALLGAAVAAILTPGSESSVEGIDAVVAQFCDSSDVSGRAALYCRAAEWVLRADSPEKALLLYERAPGVAKASAGRSGPHTFLVTWGSPGSGPTVKRLGWAVGAANGACSVSEAAAQMSASVAWWPGFGGYNAQELNLNAWQFLDTGWKGDCITLAQIACAGLEMVGVAGTPCIAWPTADGSEGFPSVSASTCQSITRKQFQYEGQTFWAKLVYPGNNHEGFFTVSDSGIRAYTVAPSGGPFCNPTYYYLEVLRSVATDQFWVWDWWAVPDAPHIPVPAVP
ncbi:hypothetical protein JW916_14940 [Candidatus Sumerlaeota bacterium]|nr:hypothetical protein [Candidatus Sumerlaeota bacterium]